MIHWAHTCPELYGRDSADGLELGGLLPTQVFIGHSGGIGCVFRPREGWGPVQVDLTPGRHRFQFDRLYVEALYWCRGKSREGTPFQYLLITSGYGGGGEELSAFLHGTTPSAEERAERWVELRAARYDTQALNPTRNRLATVMARASLARWEQPRP